MKSFKFINSKAKFVVLFLACLLIFATSLVFLNINQQQTCETSVKVFAETEQTDANTLSKSWSSRLISEASEIQSCRTIKSLVFDKLTAIPTGYSAKIVVSVDSNGSVFASYKKLADSSYDVIVWSPSTIYFIL